ncbi:MAG TPA: DUF4177 domain-containing protein [bacterium]|nr:DUF4177 domain-containing protein [bacterium]
MKWEYKTLKLAATGFSGGKINQAKLERSINVLGSEDWELVTSFVTAQGSGYTKDVFLLFKREVGS